jgi:hypothetical protein
MPQKVKAKKLIQKIITTIVLAAIVAAIGSMYNSNAYAQTDSSGSGTTDTPPADNSQQSNQGSPDQGNQGSGNDALGHLILKGGCYALIKLPECLALQAHVK